MDSSRPDATSAYLTFLKAAWPALPNATKAEILAYPNVRAGYFYTQRALDVFFVSLHHRAFSGRVIIYW